MDLIPYGRQYIDDGDIGAVAEILGSDWITQGPKVDAFERALAKYCGAKYVVAVSSGTAALHIACIAAGLGKGDEAVTTPVTFLATPNSVLYAGARPVFADIEYGSVNLDPADVERKLTKKTKAIIPVHFAGLPCDMPEIAKIAKNNGLSVIEDGCHALGARYKHRGAEVRVGSCRHSDMTVFSFHPVKHITTGEGGAITTNSRKIYRKLRALRSHGVYKTSSMIKEQGPWYYEMRDLGFNYRITDFQCALGLSQLAKIDRFLERRKKIASIYDAELSGIEGVETQKTTLKQEHAYHLYVLKVNFPHFKISRKSFFEKMRKTGIVCQVHYVPVYRQPYYRRTISQGAVKKYKNSEKYYAEAVSLPIYYSMTDSDARKVSASVRGILGNG